MRDGSSPSNDCIVLDECRKVILQEIYQEIWEKLNVAVSQSYTTWGISLLESPLFFLVIDKKKIIKQFRVP